MRRGNLRILSLILIFIIFIACVCLTFGCTGANCLSIGGTYADPNQNIGTVGGNIQWCWDETKSSQAGQPILTSQDGKNAVLITEDDAKKININLDKTITAKEESKAVEIKTKHGYDEIYKLINSLKKM